MDIRHTINNSNVNARTYAESILERAQQKYPGRHHTLACKHHASFVEDGVIEDAATVFQQQEGLFASAWNIGEARQEFVKTTNKVTLCLHEQMFMRSDLAGIMDSAARWHAQRRTYRADLHMHGLIGFQPYWREQQGYAGKNLLQVIADACFNRNIDICAITSQENEIIPGSIHDRLGWLREHEARALPREYAVGALGTQALVVAKENHIAYLVDSQTVNIVDAGAPYDHLVIGSNQVPNGCSLNDTLEFGKDHDLIQIAEHPFLAKHRGIGYQNLLRHLTYFDAIEGFNAQSYFSRTANARAKKFAADTGKPWIATSDAHRIQDLGVSYISFLDELKTHSGDELIASLRTAIRNNGFRKHEQYASLASLCSWIPTFLWGINVNKQRLACESIVPATP